MTEEARAHFVAFVAELLRADEAIESFRYLPDAFAYEIVTGDERTKTFFLGNAFAECRDIPPEARAEVIARYVRLCREESSDFTWTEARPRLRAFLKPATFALGFPMVRRPFLPHLDEVVAVDEPERMAFATEELVADWKVPVEEVFEAAREGLATSLTDALAPYDPDAPIWVLGTADAYATGRMLLSSWVSGVAAALSAQPVFAIPRRDMLLVVRDGDTAMVQRLAATAEREYAASERSVSPALYTADADGRIVPYRGSADDGTATLAKRGHALLDLAEYEAAKEHVQKEADARGESVFVATFTLVGNEESITSYAVWPPELDTVLPLTDEIVVCGNEGVEPWAFSLRTADAERVLGGAGETYPCAGPRRVRMRPGLTREQLRELYALRSGLAEKGRPPI
jgi:hypothetical protein